MLCLIFTVRVSSADFICENEAKFALIWSKDCATGVNRSIGHLFFTTEEKKYNYISHGQSNLYSRVFKCQFSL